MTDYGILSLLPVAVVIVLVFFTKRTAVSKSKISTISERYGIMVIYARKPHGKGVANR